MTSLEKSSGLCTAICPHHGHGVIGQQVIALKEDMIMTIIVALFIQCLWPAGHCAGKSLRLLRPHSLYYPRLPWVPTFQPTEGLISPQLTTSAILG